MPERVTREKLAQSWTRSHEEDEAGRLVFRTADYDFPPARGRDSFELLADGTVHHVGPGPDDRRVSTSGSWRLAGSVLTIQVPGRAEERFEVESVDAGRLVVRRR